MNSKALSRALEVSKHYPFMDKKSRRSALKELAAFGFSPYDIKVVTGSSMQHVMSVTEQTGGASSLWNIKALDALVVLASRYNMDGYVSPVLLTKVVEGNTPMRSVARLTGIPIEVLRNATR